MSRQELEAVIALLTPEADPNFDPDAIDAATGVPLEVLGSRERLELFDAFIPVDPATVIEDVTVAGVPVRRVLAEGADPASVIAWIHGGGYVTGTVTAARPFAEALSRATRCRVDLVGYRLAPEHPAPAALQDVVAVLREMRAEGPLAVGGESAGGGLTVAALMALRDLGEPLPSAVALLSPWIDLELAQARDDNLLPLDRILRCRAMYLGDLSPRDPRLNPLMASAAGLPPMFIQATDTEIVAADAHLLAAHLRNAGGEAVLDVWPGLIHGWQLFFPVLEEARSSIERVAAWLRQGLGLPALEADYAVTAPGSAGA